MRLMRGQKGQSLIEVLIALAILGIVAVTFLIALTTSSTAVIIADERTTAESLARSELEYVKNSPYNPSDTPTYSIDPTINITGYSLEITAMPLDPVTYSEATVDTGLQKITVRVYHSDTPNPDDLVLTTSNYKVRR